MTGVTERVLVCFGDSGTGAHRALAEAVEAAVRG